MEGVQEYVLVLVEKVGVQVNVIVVVAQVALVNVLMPVNTLALKLVGQIVKEGFTNDGN